MVTIALEQREGPGPNRSTTSVAERSKQMIGSQDGPITLLSPGNDEDSLDVELLVSSPSRRHRHGPPRTSQDFVGVGARRHRQSWCDAEAHTARDYRSAGLAPPRFFNGPYEPSERARWARNAAPRFSSSRPRSMIVFMYSSLSPVSK